MEVERKDALQAGNFLDVRIQVQLCLFLMNILAQVAVGEAPDLPPSW